MFFSDRDLDWRIERRDIESLERFETLEEDHAKDKSPLVLRPDEGMALGELSRVGVVENTNYERILAGVDSLSRNPKLDQAAEIKLEDMHLRGYFDHYDSDGGMGVEYLVDEVSYENIVAGENLAWGHYTSDSHVVEAWMNSPGHRENILRPQFREIGVAVKLVDFKGERGWLAVQIFGRPLSDCPVPDEFLEARIDDKRGRLEVLKKSINSYQKDISEARESNDREAQTRFVNEHNQTVDEYHELLEAKERSIETYNLEVREFNDCVNREF